MIGGGDYRSKDCFRGNNYGMFADKDNLVWEESSHLEEGWGSNGAPATCPSK